MTSLWFEPNILCLPDSRVGSLATGGPNLIPRQSIFFQTCDFFNLKRTSTNLILFLEMSIALNVKY